MGIVLYYTTGQPTSSFSMHRAVLGATRMASAPVRVHGRRHLQQRFLAPAAQASSLLQSTATATASSPAAIRYHAFSSSSRACKEKQKSSSDSKKDSKSSSGSGNSSGSPGRSPFAVFVDVLKEELQKSRELQDNVKQLQGEAGQVMDSEAMKRAKAVYERARLTASIKENPRLRAAAEALQKGGGKVNDAVAEAVAKVEESTLYRGSKEAINRAGKAVYDASEPIRDTEAYKVVAASVSEALEDVGSNTRYGGFIEKEARRKRREARLRALGRDGMAKRVRVPENLEAGENIVLHKDASSEATSSSTPLRSRLPKPLAEALANFGETYRESDNAFISMSRGVTNGLHRFFVEENETARVVRWMKTLDPDFQMESFLRELREYIVPEIVDAYTSADIKVLKEWTSEATYNVLTATIQPYIQKGLISDSRVLDIRGVDIQAVKVLENDVNVFIVSFRTQEIINFRDPKTGEIVVGDENKIEQCGYVAVMTRIEEELDNEETGGWKVIDMGRRSQAAFL